jgi:prepilin-type N-terminal cleavage/methylation domain-containing protein
MGHKYSRGFSLVEVLVVIAIIGVLLAITLPAVEYAREASRRAACANNIRQLALAIKLHEEAHKFFPTGGWGGEWAGDPDKGYGPNQPGGWIYNVLPNVEESALREIGKGLPDAQKRVALSSVLAHPIEIFYCPSRRLPRAYPFTGTQPLQNADVPQKVGKTDYVINKKISSEKSEVILSQIQLRTGVSKTPFVAEKSLSAEQYTDGQASGDQLAMYVGDSSDIARTISGFPNRDTSGGSGIGSAHPEGCNVAMGDLSVRFVLYDEELQPQ